MKIMELTLEQKTKIEFYILPITVFHFHFNKTSANTSIEKEELSVSFYFHTK